MIGGTGYDEKETIDGYFLSLMLVLGMIPAHSFEAEDEKYETVVAQLPGYDFTFAYNDGWFAESSFTYNPHISTLSALASMETGTAESMRTSKPHGTKPSGLLIRMRKRRVSPERRRSGSPDLAVPVQLRIWWQATMP